MHLQVVTRGSALISAVCAQLQVERGVGASRCLMGQPEPPYTHRGRGLACILPAVGPRNMVVMARVESVGDRAAVRGHCRAERLKQHNSHRGVTRDTRAGDRPRDGCLPQTP